MRIWRSVYNSWLNYRLAQAVQGQESEQVNLDPFLARLPELKSQLCHIQLLLNVRCLNAHIYKKGDIEIELPCMALHGPHEFMYITCSGQSWHRVRWTWYLFLSSSGIPLLPPIISRYRSLDSNITAQVAQAWLLNLWLYTLCWKHTSTNGLHLHLWPWWLVPPFTQLPVKNPCGNHLRLLFLLCFLDLINH